MPGKRVNLDYLLLLGSMFRIEGGIKAFNRNLVSAIAGLGDCRSIALLLDDDRVPADWPGIKSVQFEPCGKGSLRWLWKARFVARAMLLAIRCRPRTIICGHIGFVGLCHFLYLLTGTEYILITHGVEAWKISARWTKRSVEAAHKVLSVSSFTRDQIVRQVPTARIELLPNAVDTDRFTPGEPSPELIARYQLQGCSVLLTVGRLSASERYKGHETVLRALPRILQAVPAARYVVAGAGDYQSELEQLAVAMGLQDKVIFAGFVDDAHLVDYYRLCKVFVMPSKGEGFGITFLEALSCGRPVVAGDCDGSRDALLDGRLGTLVDPDDADAVARAVIDLLTGVAPPSLRDPAFLRSSVAAQFGVPEFRARVARVLQASNRLTQAA